MPSLRRRRRVTRSNEESIARRVDRNNRSKVATTSTRLFKKLFTSSKNAKIKKLKKSEKKEFIIQVKSLLEDGKNAKDMDPITWTIYMQRQSSIVVGLRAGFRMGSGGTSQSCTFKCKDERDECIDEDCAGKDTSYPCFCCIACNITWLACMADCILD